MPAAKPATLKLLTGRGDGKDSAGRPVNTGPAFRKVAPEPPDFLSDRAREMWDHVIDELVRLDLVKAEDLAVLVTFCETWADYRDAIDDIAVNGHYIEARQGRLRNPASTHKAAAAKELRAIAAHFGLSPLTEQALQRGDADDRPGDNPFD